jgi:hypothetical protein
MLEQAVLEAYGGVMSKLPPFLADQVPALRVVHSQ